MEHQHQQQGGGLPITMEGGSGSSDDDDDSDDEKGKGDSGKPKSKIGKKKTGGSGRRRIEIKFIENKSRRQVTFSRRKRGLMKKAYELTTLTGTQALVLIASETGHVYTFATPKLQPVVTLREGKELIQSCLNAPDNNYPPSDFLPNTAGGVAGGAQQGQGQAPKSEPHGSPQQQQQQQQQGQQGMPPQHQHHPDAAMLYGGGMPSPHGMAMHPGYAHMGGGYPHDLYLAGGGGPLPPMPMGQHMPPHHHDPSKRGDHLQ